MQAINWNALYDLVPFVPSKKREKHPWWSVTFRLQSMQIVRAWKIGCAYEVLYAQTRQVGIGQAICPGLKKVWKVINKIINKDTRTAPWRNCDSSLLTLKCNTFFSVPIPDFE